MSSGSQEKHTEVREEITKELRLFTGLGASFFRAAAARGGMTVTDMQVLDLLESLGPTTAGQLADLTGLTTGAVTGMLNRLEEAGLVRRERDPNDGRRVIVRLEKGESGSVFAAMIKAWDVLVSHYNDEQLALLLDFLQRNNALSRQEIVRLREAPQGERGDYFAPLEEISSGRLVVFSGISTLSLCADEGMGELYRANFKGAVPNVAAKDGVVTIRYPRRLLSLVGVQSEAEIKLSAAIPWHITIQGGASQVEANLGGLSLAGLEVKGGLSTINLELPVPSEVVPILISGGASEIKIRRPTGVAARVHLKGWASELVFDDQTYYNSGNNVWQQSTGFALATTYYDIEVASSASTIRITSG